MSGYGTLQDRVQCKSLMSKVMTAEQTIPFFKDGMNLGWSGFTPAGYPKVVPIALAEHVEKNNLQGKLKFNLFIGASVGAETEDRWAVNDMIDRRWPYQTGKNIAAGINQGRIRMGDKHLSLFAQDLGYGFYTKDSASGKLDLAIIEVSAIKVVVSRMQTRILDRAIQVFGAKGLTNDTPLAFLWTWGRALRFIDGPDEVHTRVVARAELRKHKRP